ncbi:MAG: hypothetical protein ABW032_12705 [Burkholderiaceae bacterium]
MSIERQCDGPAAIRRADPDNEQFWFRDGDVPHSRNDRIAEAFGLIAMAFSLAIGFVIAMLPVAAHAATAAAQAASAPSLELSAFKIVAAVPGKPEHLVPANDAQAGDRLEYQAVYRNPTDAAVHHVMVTVPVPANGVEYVIDTASPRADFASTDGKRYAPLPLQRVETTADGRTVTRPSPGADYRFIRWNLGDVPAGATRTVRTRVQLLTNGVAAR